MLKEEPSAEYPGIPILKDLGYDIPYPMNMSIFGRMKGAFVQSVPHRSPGVAGSLLIGLQISRIIGKEE